MSGVVDKHGIQWEHCGACSIFVRFGDLGYERPSEEFKHGRMLCITCTNAHPNIESVEPAPEWVAVYT